MPRDSNHFYTPLVDWAADALAGTPFSPARWKDQDQDFADALNDLPVKSTVLTLVSPSTDPTTVNPGSMTFGSGVFRMVVPISGVNQWADVTTGTPLDLSAYYTRTQVDTTFTSYLTGAQTTTAIASAVTGLKGGVSTGLDTLGKVETRIGTVESTAATLAGTVGLKAAGADLTAHTGRTDNPHAVTKAQVGLGSVDNTADANKPVSTAQAAAINARAGMAANTFTGTQQAPAFASTTRSTYTGSQPGGMATATASLGALEVTANNSGAAAFIAFVRPGTGNAMAYFGIDTDNKLRFGGWSFGTSAYLMHHEGVVASQAQAETGSDNVQPMTALRTKQAIAALTVTPIKAFVYFQVNTTTHVVTIKRSFNVTGVSRYGGGQFQVNFTNSIGTLDYLVRGHAQSDGMGLTFCPCYVPDRISKQSSSVKVQSIDSAGAYIELEDYYVEIIA